LLADSVKTAKDSLAAIREVVETLRGVGAVMPIDAIKKLVGEFSAKTGVNISLDISGEAPAQNSAANMAVIRIIQEAMTNAVRHGKASNISVNLDYSGDSITFCVRDNGSGAETVKEGYGLRGIRERVEAFGGNVEFGSSEGFYIKGTLKMCVSAE
jgi:signal transduction histidine kinase